MIKYVSFGVLLCLLIPPMSLRSKSPQVQPRPTAWNWEGSPTAPPSRLSAPAPIGASKSPAAPLRSDATEARADRGLRGGKKPPSTCRRLSVRAEGPTPWCGEGEGSGRGKAAFAVEDRWKVSGAALSLSRKVSVTAAEDNAGFYSAIRLLTAPTVKWEDVNCLVPGLLYDDPSHAGGGSPAGVAPYRAKRFTIREDYLSAPLFGMAMKDGNWAAVLDMAPRGDTTQAETSGGRERSLMSASVRGPGGARNLQRRHRVGLLAAWHHHRIRRRRRRPRGGAGAGLEARQRRRGGCHCWLV